MATEKEPEYLKNVNYDDVDEYEEVQDALRRYEESSAKLLKAVAGREELIAALKIAHPSKLAELREGIVKWDIHIARIESMMESNLDLIEAARELVRSDKRLAAFNDACDKGLAKYAEEHPEKRELIEAILTDDGKTH